MKSLTLSFVLVMTFAMPVLGKIEQARKVLIVLNEGYRPEEYFEPRKIFDKAGFAVTVAGHYEGKILPSKKHISEVPPVKTDLIFQKVTVADYDAVVFVGGNGAWNEFLPNPAVHKILMASVDQHKLTALICAATGLLATANNLDGAHPQFKGRHVTGFFEVEGILRQVGLVNFDKGAEGKPFVVKDGKLITGRDPMSAELFGQTIASELLK